MLIGALEMRAIAHDILVVLLVLLNVPWPSPLPTPLGGKTPSTSAQNHRHEQAHVQDLPHLQGSNVSA